LTDFPHIDRHLDVLDQVARGFSPTLMARAEWWLKTAQVGVGAADWPAAWERLLRFGKVFEEANPDRGKQDLIAALLYVCLEGQLPSRVRGVLGFRDDGMAPGPEILELSRHLGVQVNPYLQTAIQIAAVLSDMFPNAPELHETRAVLQERLLNWHDACRSWQMAADLSPSPETKIRAGVAYAHAGKFQSAQPLLRTLPAHQVPDHLLIWWTMAMCKSPSILDRFRAYDTLTDHAENARHARPDEHLELDDLRKGIRAIVLNLPPVLSEDEAERLESLVSAAWSSSNPELLHVIQKAKSVSTVASEELGSANRDTLPIEARVFLQVLNDEKRTPLDAEHPALSAITSLKHGADAGEVLNRVKKALKSTQPQSWRPYLILWLELPELHETGRVTLRECVEIWAKNAPVPSCGFWALARYFAGRSWMAPALACANRAKMDEAAPDAFTDELLPHLLEYIVENESDYALREWLEFVRQRAT